MALRKASNGPVMHAGPTCSVVEYGSSGAQDAATATITGRYPETGFGMNKVSDLAIRIIEGSGVICTDDASVDVAEGSVVFIDKMTPYYYEGTLEVFMVCTPAWSAAQYTHIESK